MKQWRGQIIAIRPLSKWERVLAIVELEVRFEIYDDAAPLTVLDRSNERWSYNLDWFNGLTLIQARNLILNAGGPVSTPEGVDLDTPLPPPLRTRGAALLVEHNQAFQIPSGVTLPLAFGP